MTHFASSVLQLQQLESSADEGAGEAHVARSRPCECRVAPRAPEDDGAHCTAVKRKPLRRYLAAGLFLFGQGGSGCYMFTRSSEPWQAKHGITEFKTMCPEVFEVEDEELRSCAAKMSLTGKWAALLTPI